MEQSDREGMVLDFKEIMYNLLDHILILLLSGIILAFGAVIVSKLLIKPVYTSSSSLYIISRQDNEKSMTLTDLQTGTQLTKDYQILVKSRSVMEQVISDLGLDINYDQLARMITVNAPVDTRIIEITVKSREAYTAKLLADAIAGVSAERMVKVMEMEKVSIIEKGSLPTRPSKPNIFINLLIGGCVGVFLASFIIVLSDLLNDSIKTAEDVERYLGLVTLCEIPIEENLVRKKFFKKKSLFRHNTFAGIIHRITIHMTKSHHAKNAKAKNAKVNNIRRYIRSRIASGRKSR